MSESIVRFLKMNDVEFIENQLLKDYSAVSIGGVADIIAFPNMINKLCKIIDFCEHFKIRHKILGRMSNILPHDDGYRGVIIKTDNLTDFHIEDNCISADVGISMPRLSNQALHNGLSGLEELSGIPGSLGGAIYGNAGAFGREISELVSSVVCYDKTFGKTVVLSNEDCQFSYRNSCFKKNELIPLSITLSLTHSSSSSVKKRMDECKTIRTSTQPVGVKSLGSVFKRTSGGISAAKLIDMCGLKGYSVGGAKISSKHAGFIINTGEATYADYVSVVEYTKKVVKEKFNIVLEEEIEILN